MSFKDRNIEEIRAGWGMIWPTFIIGALLHDLWAFAGVDEFFGSACALLVLSSALAWYAKWWSKLLSSAALSMTFMGFLFLVDWIKALIKELMLS